MCCEHNRSTGQSFSGRSYSIFCCQLLALGTTPKHLPVIHSGALPNCTKTKVIGFHKLRTKEIRVLIQIPFVLNQFGSILSKEVALRL